MNEAQEDIMLITTIPNHPAPMYVSAPVYALPAKLVKDTVYMPSQLAKRLLGEATAVERQASAEALTRRRA